MTTTIHPMANCQNPNCLTLGVHRKTCQEARPKTEGGLGRKVAAEWR